MDRETLKRLDFFVLESLVRWVCSWTLDECVTLGAILRYLSSQAVAEVEE